MSWRTYSSSRFSRHLRAPTDGADGNADGKSHASNGTNGLTAGSLAALLDELDWFHAG